MMKVCIVGASGKLGIYMVQHALDRGYAVVGVCRERAVEKLDASRRHYCHSGERRMTGGHQGAVAGWRRGVVVLPDGRHHLRVGNGSGGSRLPDPGARLVFSCGWHITRDGQDGLLVEDQSAREHRGSARAPRSRCGPRRPG